MRVSWKNLLMSLGMLFASVSAAQAAIIYQDSFSRNGNLNGTAPDVINVPVQNWIAGSVTTDGSQADDASGATAFLPVTIQTGKIYTLQADLNTTATDSNWMALGFSNGTATGGQFHTLGNNVGPWLLQRGDGTTGDQVFAGTNTNNGQGVSASGNTGYQTYSIVLDTTAAQWTATWFRGATQLGTTFTYTTNPTISHVGFGNGNVAGFVDNFSLSVVPEPSSLAMLAFGSVFLWFVKGRRSR